MYMVVPYIVFFQWISIGECNGRVCNTRLHDFNKKNAYCTFRILLQQCPVLNILYDNVSRSNTTVVTYLNLKRSYLIPVFFYNQILHAYVYRYTMKNIDIA